MRLGRVPLLGIDYGPSPESQFSSEGARNFARQGNLQWAHAYEELCKGFRAPPPTSDEEYRQRARDRAIIASIFGESEEERQYALEKVQLECDPDYVVEPLERDLEVPQEPVRQTQTKPANLQAWGMTPDSLYSWNKGTPVATQGRRPTIPTLPFGSLFNQSMTAAPLTLSPAASYGNYSWT